MNLYKLSAKYQYILHEIEMSEEISDEYFDMLNEINDSVDKKAVNIASFIKNLESEKNAVEQARKDMQLREKSLDRKIEYLADYLKLNLEKVGVNEVTKSPNFVIKIKKCPPSVHVFDEIELSDEYKEKVETIKIDKNKIKNDLNNGVVVYGATLIQKTRLEIK